MSAITNDSTDASDAEQPSVLVVDDQQRVADVYAGFLADGYDVTAVYGGQEALATVDATYDVVLLDRRMPDVSGDEVIGEIRSRNLGCMVAMVTAVDPDFDIIDMQFDDHLTKPVSSEELHATVERLLLMAELEAVEYELSSLQVKRNVLAAEMTDTELANSEEFARLQARVETLRTRLAELRTRLAKAVPGTAGAA